MDILVLLSLIFSTFLICYHHVGYPLLLGILRKKQRKKSAPNLIKTGSKYHRSITVVVPAYNEEKYIAEKINNLAWLDYPSDKLKVVIACDGCTDRTAQIAQEEALIARSRGLDIEVLDFKLNRGKCAVINDIAPKIKSQLVAFSDVSSLVSIDALKLCSQRFEDPNVGVVNGNYILMHANGAGEKNYWEYQKRIKEGEQALGSLLGAHGAFYMMRTRLFLPLDESTINDDFVIPMKAAELGGNTVYEQRLNALELEPTTNAQNWHRRKRIGFGNAQQISILSNILKPQYKGVALAFFSSKVLRVFVPFLLVHAFLANLYCAFIWPIFLFPLVGQICIYTCAAAVHFSKRNFSALPNTIHYVVSGHMANLLGAINYYTRNKSSW